MIIPRGLAQYVPSFGMEAADDLAQRNNIKSIYIYI